LRLLSQLMFVIKNDEKLMKLKAAQSAEDVIGLIG
jgi:mannitol/fructose-specific phosphotransferase system IIA component (Ntr-type)